MIQILRTIHIRSGDRCSGSWRRLVSFYNPLDLHLRHAGNLSLAFLSQNIFPNCWHVLISCWSQVIQVAKMAKCCPQAEERSDTSHYVVTMWSQSCLKVVPRLSVSCPKIVSKSGRSSSIPKLSKSCLQLFQECLKVGSKVFLFLQLTRL